MSKTESKPERAKAAKIDFADGSVSRDGAKYPLGGIPPASRPDLALIGLRLLIVRADDPAALLASLERGETPWRERGGIKTTARAKPLDPWREAAAHAKAEIEFRKLGVRVAPGKKIQDHEAFVAPLESAREATRGWDKTRLAAAKSAHNVREWHEKLHPEAAVTVDALFADDASAPAGVVALDEAAN